VGREPPRVRIVKKYLLTGVLIWIPLVITIWVLKLVVDVLDQSLLLLPPEWRTESLLGIHIPGQGVLLTALIVLLTGMLSANFIGERFVNMGHGLLQRIPVVNSIYSSVKQVSDTLFSSQGQAFRKAVLLQWPDRGVWTVAFLTGTPGGEISRHLQGDFVSVYVPTTPNPTSGYLVIVARSEIVELEMSVDAALRYVISMGVVAPAPRMPRNGHVS
jgi:uncharacterized membrane protein